MLAELAAAPLDRALSALLTPPGERPVDFSRPLGEPALSAPTSLSWRLFKVPLALFIGGVAAVILNEVHERSLESDLALAFCLDLQRVLRPELRLLAMSATPDGARLASQRMGMG